MACTKLPYRVRGQYSNGLQTDLTAKLSMYYILRNCLDMEYWEPSYSKKLFPRWYKAAFNCVRDQHSNGLQTDLKLSICYILCNCLDMEYWEPSYSQKLFPRRAGTTLPLTAVETNNLVDYRRPQLNKKLYLT